MRTTLLMGLIALASSLAAAYFYPWAEVELVDAKVGQPIFETFEEGKVRYIDVDRFDTDQQNLQRISLQRKVANDKWTLPAYANFNASNSALIAAVISSVQDRKVLELVSSNQEDFAKYGVVDPDEEANTVNKSGLGRKLTLRDSNQEILASLIVGEKPQDNNKQGQAYVRIAGQPNVYLIEFAPQILTTQFSDWVDPNLLRLGAQEEQPVRIEIDNYRIPPETLVESTLRENFYRASFESLDGARFAIRSLETERDGQWTKVTPTTEQIRLLEGGLPVLGGLRFVKIRTKEPALAEALAKPTTDSSEDVLNLGVNLGFRAAPNNLQPYEMVATGGCVVVKTRNQVLLKLLFGNIETTPETETKLCRLMMIMAAPDLAALPKPKPPTATEDQPLSDDAQRKYARELEDWETQVRKATNIADGYNQLHRQWYYAVDEGIVSTLRPELPNLAETRPTTDSSDSDGEDVAPATAAPVGGSESPANSGSGD